MILTVGGCFLTYAALFLIANSWGVAETWRLGSLPTGPTKLGFVMTAQIEAVGGYGYQPIDFVFAPRGKTFQRDRQLRVVIAPLQHSNTNFRYSFQQSIAVPQGSGCFIQTASVPYYYRWTNIRMELWIYATDAADGWIIDDLQLATSPAQLLLGSAGAGPELNLTTTNDTSELVWDGWNVPQKKSQHYSYQGNVDLLSPRTKVFEDLQAAEHPFAEILSAEELATQIRRGSFGLGQVIAIAAEDPFPGSFQFWKSIALLQETSRLHWSQRNGIDIANGNDNYWTWLIR